MASSTTTNTTTTTSDEKTKEATKTEEKQLVAVPFKDVLAKHKRKDIPDLAAVGLTNQEAMGVMNELKNHTQLTELDLAGGYDLDKKENTGWIKGPGIVYITNIMKNNNHIKQFSISGNPIEDEDCKVLSEIFRLNTTIDWFDISGSEKITDVGAIHIFEALEKNSTLTRILFQDCEIREDSAEAMAKMLKINTTLVHFHYDGCGIGNEGIEFVAEMLEVNKTLTDLSMSRCNIGNAGAERLGKALLKNLTLLHANWEMNSWEPKEKFALQEVIMDQDGGLETWKL